MPDLANESMYRVLAICVAALSFSLSAQTVAQGTEKFMFTFDPGEQKSYLQKLTHTKEQRLPFGRSRTDVTQSETRISITRTPTGWDLVARPLSVEMTRDGQRVDNPMLKLMTGIETVCRIDPDGNLLTIEGYEQFLSDMETQMEPAVFQALASVLTVDAMEARDRAEWDGRISGYLGAEVSVGDTFESESTFQLPDQSVITYQTITTIAGFEPCPAGRCVRIEQTYDSQSENLAKFASEVANEVADHVQGDDDLDNQVAKPDLATASISGRVSRLVHPETMTFFEESIERDMNFGNAKASVLSASGLKETKTYEFVY